MPEPRHVHVTSPLPDPGVRPLLDAGLRVSVGPGGLAGDPAREASLADAEALLCLVTDRVDAAVLDAAPALRIVANLGVGYDNVDVAEAVRRGVVVTNTPGVLTEATADLAWALLLAAARRLPEGERLVRTRAWTGWEPQQLLGVGVHGKTLGIVGLGDIGQAVARRAAGFGMRVLYTSRSPKPELERALGARFADLPALLAESDFVSLHAPLTEQTRHIIDARALELMRPGAILVNTGRGALVDEAALVAALERGAIRGAALDVFEEEPRVHPGLRDSERTVLLPHLGSATLEARSAMVRTCCDNILAVLGGGAPLTPVPPRS